MQNLQQIGVVPDPGDRPQEQTGQVDVGRLKIGGLSPEQAGEFFAYQYLIEARRAERPRHGLTSIVILTHNELAYTRKCVESIRLLTDELAQLDGFAWDLGKQNLAEHQNVDRLVGFCLLFRRKLVDEIGLLDERFGLGCFEDNDFCRRALQVGKRAVIARDAFVHHFGSRTFRSRGDDLRKVLNENQQKYDAKWNGPKPALANPRQQPRTLPEFVLDGSEEGGLLLKPNDLRLSLCMIVRDNESTIRPCLESIKPYVDEMIVVVTGSKDRTSEIYRELGARVFEFPWCDDF